MRAAGYLLFLGGLTVAAWFGARFVPTPEGAEPLTRLSTWFAVAGLPFLGGLGAMIAGGLLARRAAAAASAPLENAESAERDLGGAAAGKTLLATISEKVHALSAEGLPGDAKPLADTIDAILQEDIPAFLDHREALIDDLGLETFAEMIGHFATMERAIARAWSALTDDVHSEVGPSIAKAQTGIEAAAALI